MRTRSKCCNHAPPTSCTALIYKCTFSYSIFCCVKLELQSKDDVLFWLSYMMWCQLVAPNWRPLTLVQPSSGSRLGVGHGACPASAWCCLDTQGYLMMLSQQQPTAANIITTHEHPHVMSGIEKEAISSNLDLAMESWKAKGYCAKFGSLFSVLMNNTTFVLQGVQKKGCVCLRVCLSHHNNNEPASAVTLWLKHL